MTRFELWRDWNKHCLNHPVYKFLVLIGLAYSPSFEIHYDVKEYFAKSDIYEYQIRDEKSEKKRTIRWGWYAVYILIVCTNSVVCRLYGFDINTWQHWVFFLMNALCFIAGAEYRRVT